MVAISRVTQGKEEEEKGGEMEGREWEYGESM